MKDLRLTFDEDPEVYDRIRPAYPDRLFDDLWRFAGLETNPAICEVGAGTGKATASLLERGAVVAAVEIGAGLAAYTRDKFAGEPRLHVVTAPFESAPLAGRSFDVVFAATAWHWLAAEVRVARAAALLRKEGTLAVVDTNQVESDVDRGYFAASQAYYRMYGDPEPPPSPRPDEVVPPALDELQQSQLFGQPALFRYRWDQTYSRTDYQDLMRSYSNMRAMPLEDREGLIATLGDFIDARYGGYVTRPLVITLVAVRKL